jgi:outer membrane receptor for ferric coprogen and ferric-rhodotorulic acid
VARRDISGAVDFGYLEGFAAGDSGVVDEVLELFREQAALWTPMLDPTHATGLDMSLRETPQSVTILTRPGSSDFGLTNVNDLLAQVTGVNVEKVETDRTYYNSRGFDITNFQVDGIGLPLIWGIQFGDLDTVLFDRVEVVRGANSMMTGTGNPSATINYVRKRPTEDFQATGGCSTARGTTTAWRPTSRGR